MQFNIVENMKPNRATVVEMQWDEQSALDVRLRSNRTAACEFAVTVR